MVDFYTSMGGSPESRILATGQRVPCLHGVYVNAYLANALDFDDTFGPWPHPGGMIISPGPGSRRESWRSYGQRLHCCRSGRLRSDPSHWVSYCPFSGRYKQAWGISTHQIFGSATVAGKLLSLAPHAMAVAYGFAGNSAPVPYCRKSGVEIEERPFNMVEKQLWLGGHGWVFGRISHPKRI